MIAPAGPVGNRRPWKRTWLGQPAKPQGVTPRAVAGLDTGDYTRPWKIDPGLATFSHGGQGQMATQVERETETSEAQIAVHWREEEYIHPSPKFIGQANASDPAIFERFSEKNFPECFKEYADLLSWDQYWHTTLDTSNAPFWKWFVGGKLNASYNCVDRHLAKDRNKAAIIWVPEPEAEDTQAITYQELYRRVNEFAALLQDFCGLKAGDRVTLHMPMVPELPVTVLACARLGVIHSEVFGGFGGAACGDRAADSGSEVLITMDAYYRSGELIDHKIKADEAVTVSSEKGNEIKKVLVWQRYPGKSSSPTPMVPDRDVFVNELLNTYRGKIVPPVSMPAEAPLFLMYTSGTTARPKGCQHSTGGYLSYVAGTSKYYQDIHPEDTYWCMADIGWITGHSYIVYGPLALGATTVMYEGVPTYPDAGRAWRIAERLNVNIFHTAPTTIRMLRKVGPDEPKKYNYHFKHMTTVGEPIEPGVWEWYYNVVGKREAAIVDTWWQTENGALQAADGYFRILGRVDDVINVAGHRLGTKELESACLTIEEIAEAAAVPVMDEVRGRAVEMYVALKPGNKPSKEIEEKVGESIERLIGKVARPKAVWVVADMPKTRSGKIMRRVIASISNFTDVGDITTLANPDIVDTIRHQVQAEKVSRGQQPRELSPTELEEIKRFGQAE